MSEATKNIVAYVLATLVIMVVLFLALGIQLSIILSILAPPAPGFMSCGALGLALVSLIWTIRRASR